MRNKNRRKVQRKEKEINQIIKKEKEGNLLKVH